MITCSKLYLSIALVSSENPSVFADNVTFTATLNVDAGTMSYFDGATPIGTATIVHGVAALTISTLSVGFHNITAKFASITSNIVVQAVSAGLHGPPHGPLQLDAGTVASINGAMDFLFACGGDPPPRHLTGFMPWIGDDFWVETNGIYNNLTVEASVGISVVIDVGNGSTYVAGGPLSAPPIGTIIWTGGAILTACGPVPNIPPVGGSVSWA